MCVRPCLSQPQEMQSAIKGHLRLHYSAQEASDETVSSAVRSPTKQLPTSCQLAAGSFGTELRGQSTALRNPTAAL